VQDTKLYALEASKEELEDLLSQTGLSDQRAISGRITDVPSEQGIARRKRERLL
jgi:hypothetical protein